jgi:hypothetical protein
MFHAKTAALLSLSVVAATSVQASAGVIWSGSSGLYPDQLTTNYTYQASGTPPAPALTAGVLTLTTSGVSDKSFYSLQLPNFSAPNPLTVGARLRLDTETVDQTGVSLFRSPAALTIQFTPTLATNVDIGAGSVTLFTVDNSHGAMTANVADTQTNFHDYTFVFDSTTNNVSAYYDRATNPLPILVGPAYTTASSQTLGVFWGDATSFASGTTEWQSVSFAVPEPSSLTFAGVGALVLIARRRRKAETGA